MRRGPGSLERAKAATGARPAGRVSVIVIGPLVGAPPTLVATSRYSGPYEPCPLAPRREVGRHRDGVEAPGRCGFGRRGARCGQQAGAQGKQANGDPLGVHRLLLPALCAALVAVVVPAVLGFARLVAVCACGRGAWASDRRGRRSSGSPARARSAGWRRPRLAGFAFAGHGRDLVLSGQAAPDPGVIDVIEQVLVLGDELGAGDQEGVVAVC